MFELRKRGRTELLFQERVRNGNKTRWKAKQYVPIFVILPALLFACCSTQGSRFLSEDMQAATEAGKLFEKVSIKCDDSYFASNEHGFFELKGVTINPTGTGTTEADRLNKLTWKGQVIIEWKAFRTIITDKGINECSIWQSATINQMYQCARQNSEWTCTFVRGFNEKPKWHCDEISQFVSKCR